MDLRSALEIELRGEAFFPSRGNTVESLIPTRKKTCSRNEIVQRGAQVENGIRNYDKNTILAEEKRIRAEDYSHSLGRAIVKQIVVFTRYWRSDKSIMTWLS